METKNVCLVSWSREEQDWTDWTETSAHENLCSMELKGDIKQVYKQLMVLKASFGATWSPKSPLKYHRILWFHSIRGWIDMEKERPTIDANCKFWIERKYC